MEKTLYDFFKNKKVFITGHSGFKGSWLSILLKEHGAEIYGYSRDCKTKYDNFILSNISDKTYTTWGDTSNLKSLSDSLNESNAEIVFHLAGQSLVDNSYRFPIDTYMSNVIGTLNLLEAVRYSKHVKAVIIVTTNKCYDLKDYLYNYMENNDRNSFNPYNSSKACCELLVDSYRKLIFYDQVLQYTKIGVATVRATSVIGGGDWTQDRIISSYIKAVLTNEKIVVENPNSIVPLQHVLDPLYGYILLAKAVYENPTKFSDTFNFAPNYSSILPMSKIVEKIIFYFGKGKYIPSKTKALNNEPKLLKLDTSKTKQFLNWSPAWNIDKSIEKTVEWYNTFKNEDVYSICTKQINEYISDYQLNKQE